MKLGTLAGKRTLFILFENGEFAVILPPQPRFLPRFGLWGCPPKLSYLASDFQISHGLTLTLSAHSNSDTVSLDSTSEGLLWLGTLSFQRGTSNSSSNWKMTLIVSSLFSFEFADHVLRKEPRTDSLPVNKTTRLVFSKLRQDFMAAKTAIISSGWMTVF